MDINPPDEPLFPAKPRLRKTAFWRRRDLKTEIEDLDAEVDSLCRIVNALRDMLLKEAQASHDSRAALRGLYEHVAEYVKINNLGDAHNTHAMRTAAAALGIPIPPGAD